MHIHAIPVLCAVLLIIPAIVAELSTTIDAASNWGTWEGWGTSLAWWAKRFGDRDDLVDTFFTLETTQVNGMTLPGLDFNIARYNLGASSWNEADGKRMVESPNIKESRQMEGYWQDWLSEDPNSASWDWTADANQRSALQKAVARGANRTEIFSNSPMWWMCKNRNPSGSELGDENIKQSALEKHAIYMTTVAHAFRDKCNITFETVDPFNEPSSFAWNANGEQEGSYVEVPTQAAIIEHLGDHLKARNLSTVIAASDESLYNEASITLMKIGKSTVNTLSRINVHGYEYESEGRHDLLELAEKAGKLVWNTEYGEGSRSGKDLALICGEIGSVNQKYFVLAHFMRHIRPGMRILDGGKDDVVAAYDHSKKKLVIVAMNRGSDQHFTFNLSGFGILPSDGATVDKWTTQIGGKESYVQSNVTIASDGVLKSHIPHSSIRTFRINGITL